MTSPEAFGEPPPVRIAAVTAAHPPLAIRQAEAVEGLAAALGKRRRLEAIARASRIERRAISAPLETLLALDGIAERNLRYRAAAPALARQVAAPLLAGAAPPGVLVTTSCTGYHLPGWGSGLVEALGLPCDVARLPISEAGCAGGVVALRAAAEALRARPARPALAVAVELCSLSLHLDAEDGNLTSSLIFADGAGAARLEAGPGPGLELLDAASMLLPGSAHLLGFELRADGFFPILRRELARSLSGATAAAAARLLARHQLGLRDVAAWLVHPGGPAILRGLESALGIGHRRTRWSWDSLREHGNTSSAAIFDVLRRYLDDAPEPGAIAVVAAFGPGVAIELLLVRAC